MVGRPWGQFQGLSSCSAGRWGVHGRGVAQRRVRGGTIETKSCMFTQSTRRVSLHIHPLTSDNRSTMRRMARRSRAFPIITEDLEEREKTRLLVMRIAVRDTADGMRGASQGAL